jgi:hypothetical protein
LIRSGNAFYNKPVRAVDGAIGVVGDLYFNDRTWTVKYVVVRLDKEHLSRSVLISPAALTEFDGTQLSASLTKNEIADAPDSASDIPVYRQHQVSIVGNHFFSLQPADLFFSNGMTYPFVARVPASGQSARAPWDPHLRSVNTVSHYALHGDEDNCGFAIDMLFDDRLWVLHYIVIRFDRVIDQYDRLLDVKKIENIDWALATIRTSCSNEGLRRGLRFDPSRHVNITGEELSGYIRAFTKEF